MSQIHLLIQQIKQDQAYWMAKMLELQLTHAEISHLKGEQLAGALNNKVIRKEYVAYVNGLIGIFNPKVEEFTELKKAWETYDPEEPEARKGEN
jgi:hypothetical protein